MKYLFANTYKIYKKNIVQNYFSYQACGLVFKNESAQVFSVSFVKCFRTFILCSIWYFIKSVVNLSNIILLLMFVKQSWRVLPKLSSIYFLRKLSEKLIFLTYVCASSAGKNVSFSENFVYVLNEWSLIPALTIFCLLHSPAAAVHSWIALLKKFYQIHRKNPGVVSLF